TADRPEHVSTSRRPGPHRLHGPIWLLSIVSRIRGPDRLAFEPGHVEACEAEGGGPGRVPLQPAALVEAVDRSIRSDRQAAVAADSRLQRLRDGPRLRLIVAYADGEVEAAAMRRRG